MKSLVAAFLALWLAGCAGWLVPRSVTLSERELQRAAESRFPVERRYLEVFDVTLSAPRIALSATDQRVASRFDVAVRERLLGARWTGRMALRSALRYEAADHTVRLQGVRVEDFVLDGAGTAPAERLGALVAERLLEGAVVYALPPERIGQLQRAGLRPAGVNVTAQGVEIAFAEAPSR